MKSNNQIDGIVIDPEDDSSPENDFLSLFCDKFGCPEPKFEKRFFLECVYPDGRDLARLINWVYPGYFRADYTLIEDVKHTTRFSEFKKLVDFHDAQNLPEGVFRGVLKARLSKTRLLDVARALFGEGN